MTKEQARSLQEKTFISRVVKRLVAPRTEKIRNRQDEALQRLEFKNLKELNFPDSVWQEIFDPSSPFERTLLQDQTFEFVVQGLGQDVVMVQVAKRLNREVTAVLFLDLSSQKAVNILDLDPSLIVKARRDPEPGEPRGFSVYSYSPSEKTVYLPSEFVYLQFDRIEGREQRVSDLSLIAVPHEFGHALEYMDVKNILPYHFFDEANKENFMRANVPHRRRERAAMHFAIKFLRYCKQHGVDITQHMDNDRLREIVHSLLY